MISIQRLNARGQNQRGDAVVDYLIKTERLDTGYYADSDQPELETMRYGGKLAADPDINLLGKPVTKEVMLQLAGGFSPDGTPLCKNAGAAPTETIKKDRNGNARLDENGQEIRVLQGGHRVGFDLTFTPPKPVSMAFAIGEGQDRIDVLEAHRRAVAKTMDWLEEKVETRRGAGGKEVMGVEGLIYSQHDHLSNRNLEPNIHTHTLVYGVAKGEDGKWGTFDAREIYRHRMAADAIYKNEVAANMRELGYDITTQRQVDEEGNETGRVEYRIAGISDELCEKFSTRRQQILDYQEEHGVDAQTACLATRKHKEEPAFDEMEAMWKSTMASMEDEIPTIEQIKQTRGTQFEPDSDEKVLEKLHSNEAVFCEHNLVERLALEHAGRIRFDELMEKVDAFKQRAGLVRIEPERVAAEDAATKPGRIHTEDRFAAPWMIEWEKEIVHRVGARNNEDHQKVDPALVAGGIDKFQAKAGFQLSDEQRRAVEHITAETGGVALLSGFAGTGKTTVSDCYSQILRSDGRRMMGICVSNAAAKKLQAESGMECMSVAKFLTRVEHGKHQVKPQDVIVVDEAGMLDTNQTRKILGHADKAGAKVIMQGDVMQLQPVGAGSGMSLAKMATGDVKLTEVRRQSRVEDRDLVRQFYGADLDLKKGTRSRRETHELGRELMKGLEQRNCLEEFNTRPQALKALVDDYLADPEIAREKLVLAHTNEDVAMANDAIRQGLKAKGEIQAGGITMEVISKGKGKRERMEVAKGDRVRFTKAEPKLGVINGSAGEVIGIQANTRRGGHDLTLAMEEGQTLQMNTQDCPHLAHNFATTVHQAQGAGKRQVYHMAHTGMMDNHSALVAFSRLTKGNYRMYGTSDEFETMHERLGLERLKGTALDAGVRQDPVQQHKDDRSQILKDLRTFGDRLAERREREQVQAIGRTR